MNNYIAVRHNGDIDEFNAKSDDSAKDYMYRRYGMFWHHHYKLFKGNEVKHEK